jgi:glycosyltransferase involved in cell wall biosynthesis
MAAGRPVICLDLGGPGAQITEETGFKIPAHTPEQVVRDMAAAMTTLAKEPELSFRMGQAGQKCVRERYSWTTRGHELAQLYKKVMDESKYLPSPNQVTS